MTAAALAADLQARGVVLSVRGDMLHVSSPHGVLTDDLHSLLRTHKAALLAYLAGRPAAIWPCACMPPQRVTAFTLVSDIETAVCLRCHAGTLHKRAAFVDGGAR